MTNMNWLWEAVAWLSLPLLWLLAGILFWRRLYREYLFFFTYVVVACLVGVVRLVIYKEFSPKAYFYVFWISDFVLIVAAFASIYETFLRKVFPGFFKLRLYRYLFPLAAAAIATLAFLTALDSPDKKAAFFVTERVFDFLRSAVIGFFVVLSLVVGREFSGFEFSISLGFGIQAAVALVNSALTAFAHYKTSILQRFEPIAFDIACLIWLIAFWKAEKPAPIPPDNQLSPEMLHQARTWESSLKDFFNPKKPKL